MTADRGTWTGTPTITYAYQWRALRHRRRELHRHRERHRDDLRPRPRPTRPSTVRVVVTATNAAGSTLATTTASATVAAAPPVNTVAPTVSGTARDGEVLTGTRGTWTGTPTDDVRVPAGSRCDAAGNACAAIAGATGAHLHAHRRGRRPARSSSSSPRRTRRGSATSRAITGDGRPPRPRTPPLPAISGTARDGSTLTADHRHWSGTPPIRFTYAWLRCDAGGANCAQIAGATGGDVHRDARPTSGASSASRVTATNDGGTATADVGRDRGRAARARQHRARRRSPAVADGGHAQRADRHLDRHARRSPSRTSGSAATRTAPTAATSPARPPRPTRPIAADIGDRIRVVVTATNAGRQRDRRPGGDRAVEPGRAGQHRRPDGHRHGRATAQTLTADPARGPARSRHVRVPVAALRRGRRELRGHPRRDGGDVHPRAGDVGDRCASA